MLRKQAPPEITGERPQRYGDGDWPGGTSAGVSKTTEAAELPRPSSPRDPGQMARITVMTQVRYQCPTARRRSLALASPEIKVFLIKKPDNAARLQTHQKNHAGGPT